MMTYPNPHAPGCPWHPYAESLGSPNIKWCEETLCHWISEPANTWSNLGYLIVGLYVFYLALKNKESFALKQFGPIIFFMGAMSLIYHLSNFYGTQILDFVGMFFFVGWAKGMNLIRLGYLKEKHLIAFNLIVSAIFTVIMHLMYLNGMKYQSLVLISGIIIAVTEVMAQKKKRTDIGWFIASLLILVVAFSFSIMDGKRIWCVPTNHGWFSQGHALWHWTAAVAMYTIYRHFAQPKLTRSL